MTTAERGVNENFDVGAIPEHLLIPAADFSASVRTRSPGVSGVISPLQSRPRTGEAFGQFDLILHIHLFVFGGNVILDFIGIFRQWKWISIEALLSGDVLFTLQATQLDDEVAIMVGCHVDLDVDVLTGDVALGDVGLPEFAAGFVIPRLRCGKVVTADAAFAPILFVLDAESTAEDLVVVVVDFIGEAEAPHHVPRRRFHEAAVTIYVMRRNLGNFM